MRPFVPLALAVLVLGGLELQLPTAAHAQAQPRGAQPQGSARAPARGAAAPRAVTAPSGATPEAAADAPAPLPTGPFRDCPTCPEMVVVPAGTFVLGTSGDAAEVDRARGEAPPLPVTMNRAYAIGRTEVTVGQWREFVAATGYGTLADCRIVSGGGWTRLRDSDWRNPGFASPQEDSEPVVCISWDDARAYVDWLSRQTGRPYRLPSETEWEYAARGGTTSPRYFGNRDSHEDTALSVACDHANVYDTSAVTMLDLDQPNARCNDQRTYTAPVASYAPNAFDLHDAIGNVREWLQDCYTASYQGRPQDGRAWEWAGGCELRGVRGGSFATRPAGARSAARDAEPHDQRQSDLGFRVARDL